MRDGRYSPICQEDPRLGLQAAAVPALDIFDVVGNLPQFLHLVATVRIHFLRDLKEGIAEDAKLPAETGDIADHLAFDLLVAGIQVDAG